MYTGQYFEQLDKLNLDKSDYVITGNIALQTYGLLPKKDDIISIIVKPEVLNKLLIDSVFLGVNVITISDKVTLPNDVFLYTNSDENNQCYINVVNNLVNIIDYTTPLSYYFSGIILLDSYPYLPKMSLRHYYQCLYNTYKLDEIKKELDLIK